MSDARLRELFAEPIPADRLHNIDHPKQAMFRRCLEHLPSDGDAGNVVAFFVPGRIEVFGKHTDYCGGRSILCAVDRGFAVVARPRADRVVRVIDAARGDDCLTSLADPAKPPLGHWSNYPLTVVRRVADNFDGARLTGADIAFISDLPQAAGMSSSSAMIITVFLAVASINRLDQTEAFTQSIQTLEDLAHYCGCIENGSGFRGLAGSSGVGTSGGSQDHTAILCCRANMLSQYSFAPVRHERDIPFPADVALVVLDSGVVAEKTGSALEKYNNVSRRARALVELWNRSTGQQQPTLAAVVRSAPDAAARLRELIGSAGDLPFERQELVDRLDQFIAEAESIIPAAADAFAAGDLDRLRQCVDASVAGAIDKLYNQIPQTIELYRSALAAGAIAASPFGAGFGGSVWAMVRRDRLEAFTSAMQTKAAGVHVVNAASSAHVCR